MPQQPVEVPLPKTSGVYAPNVYQNQQPSSTKPGTLARNPPQVQHPELQAFLKVQVSENKFNKYCVDCLKNRTAYVVINWGLFVCPECAYHHSKNFPMQNHYLKEIFAELYDPYQIQCLRYAGNKAFFELMKEYGLDKESFKVKYTSDAAKWYKKQFKAKVNNTSCFEKKPPLQPVK